MLGTPKIVELSTKQREGVHTIPLFILDRPALPSNEDCRGLSRSRKGDAKDLAPSSEDLLVGVKPKEWDLSGLPESRPQSHNHPPDHRISTMGKER